VTALSGATVLRWAPRIGTIASGMSRVSATSTKISGSSTNVGWKKA
jgi:hypothetical protein